MKKFFGAFFLLFLIVATIWIVRSNAQMPFQKNAGPIFGTEYHIQYRWAKDLQAGILNELHAVDNSLSMFNKQSTISRINRKNDVDVSKDSKFIQVFKLAQKVSETTHGSFDITVAPLVNEWGFGFKKGVEPTKQVIDSLRSLTGWQKVKLESKSNGIFLHKDNPGSMLDCSAIAKGFGVDMVADYLEKQGVKDYLVEIGGEIRAHGMNPNKKVWTIGISNPSDSAGIENPELATALQLTDCAVATSGNYRNYYYKNGHKYAHTIDPHSGYPVQHSVLSATVVAPTCAEADAFATSFMVMGLGNAQKLLQSHSNLKAILIYSGPTGKKQIWKSKGLKTLP